MEAPTTLSIDLDGALRKRKPEKRTAQLVPRALDHLVHWTELRTSPLAVLLDTNIYIHRAAGRLPAPLREIIDQALLFHCSVAIAELAVGVSNADPSRLGWRAMRDHYAELFAAIPATRLIAPDAQVWADAGVIAGTLARTQGFQRHQRNACLNDALI